MISLKILEKEYERCSSRIENIRVALEYHEEELSRYKNELEFYTASQIDLKSAICKLIRQ